MSVSEFPNYAFERKKLGQDGAFWPLARSAMRHPRAIKERMREDVADEAKKRGAFETVCDAALRALGWRPDQVRAYGEWVAREIHAENACGNDPLAAERAA